jgi:hypothetical protein
MVTRRKVAGIEVAPIRVSHRLSVAGAMLTRIDRRRMPGAGGPKPKIGDPAARLAALVL